MVAKKAKWATGKELLTHQLGGQGEKRKKWDNLLFYYATFITAVQIYLFIPTSL